MRNISGKELLQALTKAGFHEHHVRGSHFYLLHPDGGRLVCIPVHGTRALKPKTISSILKQAGLTEEELRRHL